MSRTYQDKWMIGRVSEKGYRQCSNRYEIVKAFCDGFTGPFTVCDIGANMCYFGLRLTEDFQECRVFACEFDHFMLRKKHLEDNKASRIFLLNRRLTLDDLKLLSYTCHFDVVLALSVIHHLPGPSENWISALLKLGDHLIVELALDDSKTSKKKAFDVPPEATLIGESETHFGSIRPIYHFKNERT